MTSFISIDSNKKVVKEIPTFLKIYSDGSVERLQDTPIVPPCPQDPKTGTASKDVVISVKPFVSARLFIPKLDHEDQKLPILVYFRGGAFIFESAFSDHFYTYLNHICLHAKFMAVAIDYRMAPEHLLPAGYNDCWTGLQWVASHSTKSPPPIDPWLTNHGNFDKVFFGGDSSGGNIVHNMLMRAGSEPLPGNLKIYGAFMNHPSFWGSTPIGSEPMDETYVPMAWRFTYPSAPGGLDSPMLNPMAEGAPSLANLGCRKLFVSVAGKDYLHIRDRAVLYCESLKKSGWQGDIEFFEEEDEDHCYHMNFRHTPQAQKLIALVIDFLRKHGHHGSA